MININVKKSQSDKYLKMEGVHPRVLYLLQVTDSAGDADGKVRPERDEGER
jgi:hypothetical protein